MFFLEGDAKDIVVAESVYFQLFSQLLCADGEVARRDVGSLPFIGYQLDCVFVEWDDALYLKTVAKERFSRFVASEQMGVGV